MADLTLPRESVQEVLDYNVLVTEFENQSEQRRLKSLAPLRGFTIKTPDLTKSQAASYRSHFAGQYGALTSFNFTSPIDSVTYNVRYVQGSFKTTHELGYFKCEFELKVIP